MLRSSALLAPVALRFDRSQVADGSSFISVQPKTRTSHGAFDLMTTTAITPLAPADVHRTLARHILADGFDLVFDYEKSHGAWVFDSRTGREYLDFLTFFGSNP
jgi:hypothetical protein